MRLSSVDSWGQELNAAAHSSLSKATRMSTSKVRTGCITCKKRHVKCDEAKPSCYNCLKTRGQCEGYAPEPKRRPPARHTILMRRPGQFVRADNDMWPLAQMQLDADRHDFPDSDALLSFREFVSLMQNPWMSGLSNSEGRLWKETMPQLCRNDPTLRSAAMAIGAISLWRENAMLDANAASSGGVVSNDRYYYHQALAYYGQALMRQSRHASFQSAAFLSLLLLIFESLRPQMKAALDYVNHGMALLLCFVTGPKVNDHISGFAPNPRPVLAQLADVFTHLATQTRLVLHGRVGQHAPLPDLARGLRERDMTMEAFVLLLSRVAASKSPPAAPSVFSSLDEFEEHLVSLTRRQAEMGPIMRQAMEDTRIAESEDQQHITGIFPVLLCDPNIQRFCDGARQEMETLDRAFTPLLHKITLSTPIDSPIYLRALHLRLRYLAVSIFNNPPQYPSLTAMTSLGPRFREFVSLAEVILRASKKLLSPIPTPAHHHRRRLLCVDGGLAWHLLQVALHCRDPVTRDEAILLLREYPGRDGLWSTRALWALAARNRLLERDNDDAGNREEEDADAAQTRWRRLLRREYYLEDGGARLVFRFLERDGEGSAGEWLLVEEVADFGGDDDDEYRGADGNVEWKRQPLPKLGNLLVREAMPLGRLGGGDRESNELGMLFGTTPPDGS